MLYWVRDEHFNGISVPVIYRNSFAVVLGSTPRVLASSLFAFVMGDLINDNVFSKMKKKHADSHEGFSVRAIVSSFCGEVVDSCIFIPLAFLGQMPIATLLQMLVIQVTLKTAYEIII